MAIRPLLVGMALIVSLILIVLSILLVDPSRPVHQSESLVPASPVTNPR